MLGRLRSGAGAGPARRRTAGAVVVLLLAATIVGCGSTQPHGFTVYAALGDSYTSGAGITPLALAGCGRSTANYPSLVAKARKGASFTDASCSGAMTSNLTTAQGWNAPQLDAVSRRTDLVTLGIGLNDYGLAYRLLALCLPVNGAVVGACTASLQQPLTTWDTALAAVAADVAASLRAIHDKAPGARVILVGYPRILPDSGTCPALPLSDAAAGVLRYAFAKIDPLLAEVATAAGAEYVDTYQASLGHDVCSSDPWINGIYVTGGSGVQLHPRPAYHVAVAALIQKLLDR